MTRCAVLFIIVLLATSCTSSLFKVKPVTELPPLPANTRSADAGGVTIRVAPLLTDEESQELFEANLPLSGVLPLRTTIDQLHRRDPGEDYRHTTANSIDAAQ